MVSKSLVETTRATNKPKAKPVIPPIASEREFQPARKLVKFSTGPLIFCYCPNSNSYFEWVAGPEYLIAVDPD